MGAAGDGGAPAFAAAQAATRNLVRSLAAPLAADAVALAAIALAEPGDADDAEEAAREIERAGALAVELAAAGLDAAGHIESTRAAGGGAP